MPKFIQKRESVCIIPHLGKLISAPWVASCWWRWRRWASRASKWRSFCRRIERGRLTKRNIEFVKPLKRNTENRAQARDAVSPMTISKTLRIICVIAGTGWFLREPKRSTAPASGKLSLLVRRRAGGWKQEQSYQRWACLCQRFPATAFDQTDGLTDHKVVLNHNGNKLTTGSVHHCTGAVSGGLDKERMMLRKAMVQP